MSDKLEITVDQNTMAKFFKDLSDDILAGKTEILEARQNFAGLEDSDLWIKIHRIPQPTPTLGTFGHIDEKLSFSDKHIDQHIDQAQTKCPQTPKNKRPHNGSHAD